MSTLRRWCPECRALWAMASSEAVAMGARVVCQRCGWSRRVRAAEPEALPEPAPELAPELEVPEPVLPVEEREPVRTQPAARVESTRDGTLVLDRVGEVLTITGAVPARRWRFARRPAPCVECDGPTHLRTLGGVALHRQCDDGWRP